MNHPTKAARPARFENIVTSERSSDAQGIGVRDRARLMGLVGAEMVSVGALHRLGRSDGFAIGWSDLSAWFESAPFEDAAGAVVLVVALLIAYWLLFSTLAYLAASVSGRPKVLGAADWLTLPSVRRLVNRAVALSIAASAVTGSLAPAVAGSLAPADAGLMGGAAGGPVIVEVDQSGRFFPPGTQESPAASEENSSEIIVPPHLEPSAPVADEPRPVEDHSPAVEAAVETTVDGPVVHSVTVRRGDHLWSLSEHHLSRVLGRSDLGDHEIARYWVRVIEANRGTIRSGNPDLIYPGEVIVLPAVPTTP